MTNATTTEGLTMTKTTHYLFIAHAEDARNWSGSVPWGVNVEIGNPAAARGNLTDLKKRGLVTTYDDLGMTWLEFTAAGKAYAIRHGVRCRHWEEEVGA